MQCDINKIEACIKMSNICGFRCCDHKKNSKHSHYIMMYPGEFENSNLSKDHIEIIENKNGALIGRCTYSISERKKCDGNINFKPLDCYSYPFFPTIKNGKLVLLKDNVRCPLSKEDVSKHYFQVLSVWEDLVKDKQIFNSIEKFKLCYYTEFLL